MKTQINHPALSKINGVAILILAVGVANTAGWIPQEYHEHALTAATLLAPALIVVARTWFTAPKS